MYSHCMSYMKYVLFALDSIFVTLKITERRDRILDSKNRDGSTVAVANLQSVHLPKID